MPQPRIHMRQIREVLRLHFESGRSIRQINASTKTSVGAIQKLLKQARELNLNWPLPGNLDDARLAALFYPATDTPTSKRLVVLDWKTVHQELKRKGLTKQLLWPEDIKKSPISTYFQSRPQAAALTPQTTM